MNDLRADIDKKYGSLAAGARDLGISRQALYDVLKVYERTNKMKLSTSLQMARVLRISYNEFKRRYLED